MTYDELVRHFNSTYTLNDTWPLTYDVDAITYAKVCDGIFKRKLNQTSGPATLDNTYFIDIAIGPHGGIKLRNIELILKV